MDIIFSDSHSIDEATLKKLMLIANGISFVNRPSIGLGKNTGTVGMYSNISGFEEQFSNDVVRVKVFELPSSFPITEYCHEYFKIDQSNVDFKRTVIDGIKYQWIDDLMDFGK